MSDDLTPPPAPTPPASPIDDARLHDPLAPVAAPADPAADANARDRLRQRLWIAIAAGAAVLLLGVWLVIAKLPAFLNRPAGGGAPAAPVTTTSGGGPDARRIQATLYFVAPDGLMLVPASRDVLYGATPAEQARHIVEAQVAAPAGGAVSSIPPGTTVRSVFLAGNGEAYVDLGGAIATGFTGGSLDEALAVYAIVDALTTNLRDVTSVQILIDGKEVDSLAGHLDLRSPLGKAPEWVRKGQ